MAIIAKLWRLKIISSVRVMMRVENNNVSGQNHDPEQIDLIDLLVQLWRGKMTIIISVIVAIALAGNDSNLLIVFYVQIMPDDFVMQLHRF